MARGAMRTTGLTALATGFEARWDVPEVMGQLIIWGNTKMGWCRFTDDFLNVYKLHTSVERSRHEVRIFLYTNDRNDGT